jgi:hypothetical protein
MLYFLTAAALVLHTCFWGGGLAVLLLPRGWRRFWWVFAPGFGLALQSAVVWFGAHTSLRGTDAYVWASEVLPLVLAGWALLRHGPDRAFRLRISPVLLVVLLGVGWLLLAPMAARGGWTLTSSSLGSNDHADYAAGARVFQEFSGQDRTGFLGQTEVTRVGSAETFHEFWLRLNHFTPSALIAHNAAMLDLKPYQLVSLSGAVLVLLNLPLAVMLARVATGLRGWPLAGLGLLYGVSPLTAYAVHHGALGQLYAAHGIALLTLSGWGALAAARRGRSVWEFAALALAALWLLAGSYNFILLVAAAPLAAWAVLDAVSRRSWRPAARTAGLFAAMLAVCVVLFWGRFSGLVERFRLFEVFDFGWPVTLLSPEGWLGVVHGTSLQPWAPAWRLVLSAAALALWGAGLDALWRRRRDDALGALALVVPVIAGWGLLVWEARTRANASYDAFKILSVFYPGLLAGLCCWAAAARGAPLRWRAAAGGLLLLLLAANAVPAADFFRRMRNPPLRVERAHLDLGRLESDDRVTSINMRIEAFWARLWANAFLLRKPQYFPTHTYEGRLNTPLRGEWDLFDGLVRSEPYRREDFIDVNSRFHAVRVGAAGWIDATLAGGWHAVEGAPMNRWRWTAGEGEVRLTNSGASAVRVRFVLRGRTLGADGVELWCDDRRVGRREFTPEIRSNAYIETELPPGVTTLRIRNVDPAVKPGDGDERLLGFALYGLTIQALRDQPARVRPF